GVTRPSGNRNTSLSARVSSQQVPPVALEIQKHCKSTVGLIARWRDEPDTSGDHALVSRIEVVNSQEHSDAAAKLLPHNACLRVAIGTRKQDAGLARMGANHDPTLRTTVVGQRRRVFHELELKDVDEETDGRVIVPDHERDQFKM